MSRLGDLIKLERTRRGLSAKQVARKCSPSAAAMNHHGKRRGKFAELPYPIGD